MSHPDITDPCYWVPVSNLEPGSHAYMACHWRDIERGIVVPKYAGQIFYFADFNGMRMFTGLPEAEAEPEPQRSTWLTRIVIIIGLTLFGIDLWLAWILFTRLEWL